MKKPFWTRVDEAALAYVVAFVILGAPAFVFWLGWTLGSAIGGCK